MKKKRRRNADEDSPGLIRGLYDTVTGAPIEFAHGILDEADQLLGTGAKKKNRNPRRSARKSKAGPKGKNPGVIRMSEREAKRYSGKVKGLSSIGGSTRRRTHKKPALRGSKRSATHASKRGATKGMKRTYRVTRAFGRGIKRGGKAIGRTAKAAGRGFFSGLFNPSGEHVPGLPAKYQRMYEDIVRTPGAKERYGSRLKSVAAATARKASAMSINPAAFKNANPFFFGFRKHKGRVSHAGKRGQGTLSFSAFTKRGLKRKKRRAKKKLSRLFGNPPSFNEFRGRTGKGTYEIVAADGTPRDTKEAGGLEELTIGGRLVHGNNGRPKVVGGRILKFNPRKQKLLYRGQNLYLGNVKMHTRAHKNPERETAVGPVSAVVYHADKPHLSHPKNEPYEHFFGDEGGKRPVLVCDTDGLCFLSGGSYRISPDGIIN